jgi:hypothetical protein
LKKTDQDASNQKNNKTKGQPEPVEGLITVLGNNMKKLTRILNNPTNDLMEGLKNSSLGEHTCLNTDDQKSILDQLL